MKRKPSEENLESLNSSMQKKLPPTYPDQLIEEQLPYSYIEYVWGIAYSNGTVMGEYLKTQFDHTKTPLPHPSEWSVPLKVMMSSCLTNQTAIAVCWGPDLCLLYNDNYMTLLDQSKSLSSFGRPVKDVFPEIWDVIDPLFSSVLAGKSIKLAETLLPIMKEGVVVERYFTFTYSPLVTNVGIEGAHVVCVDATTDIFSRRQFSLLRELAAHSAFTTKEAHQVTIEALATNKMDVPFAMLYTFDKDGLCLAGQTGLSENLTPEIIIPQKTYDNQIVQGIIQASRSDKRVDVSLSSFPPCGYWNKSPSICSIFPIINPGQNAHRAILVLGVNQMRLWDETYQSFFGLVAIQITTTLSSAEAHEEERARLEKLAEFDRAKTIFFSNISHEFRTPLTLILGPLEDMISSKDLVSMENLKIIHRNTLRLLKLVNSLLDFSRIEAGRMVGNFVPTDLGKLTEDLASIFRSGAEKAGLEYIVDCPSMKEPVYIDHELWEKIVLNLISNAYKYTFSGKIQVTLHKIENTCVFTVSDTGIGIPEKDLPHLFKRFYRVTGSTGRHHEGTGIGLALVEELVKLHGGIVTVISKVNEGTCFTITLPLGYAHLPSQYVCHKPLLDPEDKSLTHNVKWWLPTAELEEEIHDDTSSPSSSIKYRVLYVDDNPDMREYVRRLLSQKYEVEVAIDGIEGLKKAIANPPHLILSDIMMPNLDGYGLLKELRANPKTRTLPVIFLSARAGQEPQAEGLESGADDYLVKPFTARELLSRIKAHIKMSQFRVEMTKLEQANEAKDHFLAVLSHELRTPLTPVLFIAESLETNFMLDATIREDIALIKRNIALEVRLIDDLLDVTKISKGRLEMHMEEVSIHQVLEYALQLLEHDIEEKSMKVKRHLNATEYYIKGDPSRIQQVLWNIIKNAIKFTPNNGTITIVTKTIENSRISVEITDTGKGIDPEFLPKVFTSFEQEKSSRQFGGLGLGLSISRVIATMHNGSLTVQSPGVGKVELPIIHSVSAKNAQNATSSVQVPKPEQAKHILVVEDNKPTLAVLQRFLKRLGHNVTSASTVAEALKQAEQAKGTIDLVVSDIGLPDASGLQLMQQLKTLYGLKGIALSGYGMESDVQKSKEAGFEMHLTKPVQIAVLSSAIQKVLN